MSLSIILVDDSELVRELVGTALRSMGHKVLALAPDEGLALKALAQEHSADAVVLDLLMTTRGDSLALMLGPPHARAFKVLFCSSVDTVELARRASAADADGYVSKDAHFRTVAQRIVAEIARSKS